MSREKTYAEEAVVSRRWVKGLRIYGAVLILLGVAALVFAVTAFVSGHATSGVVTLFNAGLITFWGFWARGYQARRFEENAKNWDRLAGR